MFIHQSQFHNFFNSKIICFFLLCHNLSSAYDHRKIKHIFEKQFLHCFVSLSCTGGLRVFQNHKKVFNGVTGHLLYSDIVCASPHKARGLLCTLHSSQ